MLPLLRPIHHRYDDWLTQNLTLRIVRLALAVCRQFHYLTHNVHAVDDLAECGEALPVRVTHFTVIEAWLIATLARFNVRGQQREGRVDRYGQSSEKVRVIRLMLSASPIIHMSL